MSTIENRWEQRLDHFQKAFARLQSAVLLAQQRQLSELEEQGLIQAFEFTHELAWQTLRDFLQSKRIKELYGSRDTTRAAFQAELIINGEAWMEMIRDRNLTSHTYNFEVATRIAADILHIYHAEFTELLGKLNSLKSGKTE